MIKLYSLIYVIGMSGMGCLFVVYFIPQLLHMVSQAILQLSMGATQISAGMRNWQMLDSVVILILIALQIVLLVYSWIRNWRMARNENETKSNLYS